MVKWFLPFRPLDGSTLGAHRFISLSYIFNFFFSISFLSPADVFISVSVIYLFVSSVSCFIFSLSFFLSFFLSVCVIEEKLSAIIRVFVCVVPSCLFQSGNFGFGDVNAAECVT